MQKPIPCLYYAQHVTELAILPSFKLNTSFNLEKEKRRREKKKGAKSVRIPERWEGARLKGRKRGVHTLPAAVLLPSAKVRKKVRLCSLSSSPTPPLRVGRKDDLRVAITVPPLACCTRTGTTKERGAEGLLPRPVQHSPRYLHGCLVESHKCSQRQACCACGVRFLDLMTMAVVVVVVAAAGVHEDLDGRSETSYSSSMSCW